MIRKLWPTRSKHIEGPVQDLDAIVSDPVPFRFQGTIHYLKPFTVAEYLKFVNAQFNLENSLRNGEGLTAETLTVQYHAVISSVCDTITIDHIKSMEQVQVAALYQLVIDMITGMVDMGDGKKKRKRLDIYDSVQPSSSQSAQENLDGPPKPH